MNINGLKAYQDIQSIVGPKASEKSQSIEPKTSDSSQKTKGFGDFLKDAVQDVNTVQNQAEKQIEGIVLNKPGFTSHEAMLALEKADIAFQLMNAVRSKIVRAYEEVMRTQV